ncbi:MAG: hypothetical protein ACRC7O_14145, partial [Fimbriiglobus sp.]
GATPTPAGRMNPMPARPSPGFGPPAGAPQRSNPPAPSPMGGPSRPGQVSLPSRASFQLPDEEPLPLEPVGQDSSAPFASAANRASTGWLSGGEEPQPAKKPALGTAGVVALTFLLTVLAYFGATILLPMLKQ